MTLISDSQGSQLAAGYDLYSAYDYVIPAGGKVMAKTDIQAWNSIPRPWNDAVLHQNLQFENLLFSFHCNLNFVDRSRFLMEHTAVLLPGCVPKLSSVKHQS